MNHLFRNTFFNAISILALVLTGATTESALAFGPGSDVDCDEGTFVIDRAIPQGGYVFYFTFGKHLLEHFMGNSILSTSTTTSEGKITFVKKEGVEAAWVNVGPTYRGETPWFGSVRTGSKDFDLEFTRDPDSSGHFLRAYPSPDHRHKKPVAEYYIANCHFGPQYR
jgi:hypothetical protein